MASHGNDRGLGGDRWDAVGDRKAINPNLEVFDPDQRAPPRFAQGQFTTGNSFID